MRRSLPVALLVLPLMAVLAACKQQPAAPAAGGAPAPAEAPAGAQSTAAAVADKLNPLPSAKDEIKAAMDAFLDVKSFHATMNMTGAAMPGGGMTTEMDFVAPDRYRMQMPMGTQIIVGDTMYMNVQGRSMKVPMPKGTLSQWRDPAKLAENQATLTVEAQGSDTVDGIAARKYLVRNTQPKPTDVTMWIGEDGLPVQIHHSSSAEGKTADVTIRYTRFNDPSIKIDPPQ